MSEHASLAVHAGVADIYLSVNPVHETRIHARNQNGRGTKTNRELTAYRAAHCEMDIGKPGYPPTLEAALQVIQSLPVQPSVIVFTGGGIHCWWVLDEPIALTPDDHAAWDRVLRIEQQWKALVCNTLQAAGYETYKGDAGIDRGTFDLTRMLRLPGTTHSRRGVMVEEIGGTGDLVSTQALLDALPQLPQKARGRKPAPQGPAVEDDDVLEFLAEHSVAPECNYGRAAADSIIQSMLTASEHHPEAVRSAIRIVGLMARGCCWTDDLLRLRDAFFEVKPEADDAEWNDILRWAVQHHDPKEQGCDMHTPQTQDGKIPSAWPEPKPIVRYSTEPFPVQALPAGMRAAAEEVACNVVVPIAIPALAFLAVASGLIGAWVDVLVRPGWVRRANLYLAVVAETATGKTPGIVPALAPVLILEEEAVADIAEEQTRARALLPGWRDDIKRARRDGRDDDAIDLQRRIDEADATLARQVRLKVDDVTPERLAMLMHDNEGRMLAVNDEGSILGHALGLYAQNPNIDLLLKANDASETYTADRKGGANGPTSVRIERPTLTMLSAIQPSMIDRIGDKPELLERGLVGRVMWSWPEDTVGLRLLSGRPDTSTIATDAWNETLLRMARDRRGCPITMPFTGDGLAAYLNWHDAVEREIPAARALADVRVFVPKVRDAVAKTAALFAVLEGAAAADAGHVQRAVLLGEYWIGQARNIIGTWATAVGAYSAAEKVLRWAMKRPDPLAPFTVRDARYHAHLKGDIAAALEVLEHHGWVRPADTDQGYGDTGRAVEKKSAVVEVNPEAATAFTAHGRRLDDTPLTRVDTGDTASGGRACTP